MTTLKLDQIRDDGGTQPRAQLDQPWITELAEALGDGATLKPVIVFYDGCDRWLADGFHRLAAHRRMRRVEIEADVRQGSRRDAILFSCGANATHGLRRSNDDKRRAVECLLRDVLDGCLPGHHACRSKLENDQCWSLLSDREISRRCGVSAPFVGKIREEINPAPAAASVNGLQITERTVTRSGADYPMQTANIGTSSRHPPPSVQAATAREKEQQRRAIDRSVSQETSQTTPQHRRFDCRQHRLLLRPSRSRHRATSKSSSPLSVEIRAPSNTTCRSCAMPRRE